MADFEPEVYEMARAMNDRVWREASTEKAQAVLRQAEIARIMEKTGSIRSNGLGQRTGVIDARTFMRWDQEHKGCWSDPTFRRQFLADNPQCRAPGYNPKSRGVVFDMGAKAKA
jgi:hypothetical protein